MKSVATLRRAPSQDSRLSHNVAVRESFRHPTSPTLRPVNVYLPMLRLSSQRRICLDYRIVFHSHQICRPVSTSSAINRGLRATKDNQEPNRGGRDRSRRPDARTTRFPETSPRKSALAKGSQRTGLSDRGGSLSESSRNGRDRPARRQVPWQYLCFVAVFEL